MRMLGVKKLLCIVIVSVPVVALLTADSSQLPFSLQNVPRGFGVYTSIKRYIFPENLLKSDIIDHRDIRMLDASLLPDEDRERFNLLKDAAKKKEETNEANAQVVQLSPPTQLSPPVKLSPPTQLSPPVKLSPPSNSDGLFPLNVFQIDESGRRHPIPITQASGAPPSRPVAGDSAASAPSALEDNFVKHHLSVVNLSDSPEDEEDENEDSSTAAPTAPEAEKPGIPPALLTTPTMANEPKARRVKATVPVKQTPLNFYYRDPSYLNY